MTNPQYPGAGDQPGGIPPQPAGGPAQPFGGHPQAGMYGPGQNPYAPGPQQYPPQGMQPGYGPPPYPPQPGGPYAPQQGGPYPPQPGKSRGTVVLVTLVVVVLVVGLGVGGYFLLSGGGRGSDPRAVAQQFVDGDGENKELICASDLAKIEEAGASAPRPNTRTGRKGGISAARATGDRILHAGGHGSRRTGGRRSWDLHPRTEGERRLDTHQNRPLRPRRRRRRVESLWRPDGMDQLIQVL